MDPETPASGTRNDGITRYFTVHSLFIEELSDSLDIEECDTQRMEGSTTRKRCSVVCNPTKQGSI